MSDNHSKPSKKSKDRFWETIPFKELNDSQWESICDSCCQCCAHKLIDDDTDELFQTNVVCQYLDTNKCQCTVYSERHKFVPDCIKITPENAGELTWIPKTCGYRLLAEGKPLPKWHPLETGDPLSAKKAGYAVTDKVISDADVNMDELEDYLVDADYFNEHDNSD